MGTAATEKQVYKSLELKFMRTAAWDTLDLILAVPYLRENGEQLLL